MPILGWYNFPFKKRKKHYFHFLCLESLRQKGSMHLLFSFNIWIFNQTSRETIYILNVHLIHSPIFPFIFSSRQKNVRTWLKVTLTWEFCVQCPIVDTIVGKYQVCVCYVCTQCWYSVASINTRDHQVRIWILDIDLMTIKASNQFSQVVKCSLKSWSIYVKGKLFWKNTL